jgi:lysophospholipase L1-like esterase
MKLSRLLAMGIFDEAQYWQRIKGQLNVYAYFPLWETTGTVVTDIANARNGVYVNTSLANTTSLANKPCPLFSSSVANIHTAGFNTAFMASAAAKGFVAGAFKVSLAGVWTDGAARMVLDLTSTTATHLIRAQRPAGNNTFTLLYISGGVTKTLNATLKNTGFVHFILTWDNTTTDTVKLYINGVLTSTQTGIGAWTDTDLLAAWTHIGSHSSTAVSSNWDGWISDAVFGTDYITDVQARSLATLSIRPRAITLIGDSITAAGATSPDMWSDVVLRGYNSGYSWTINHAAGSATIAAQLAGQVTASASDMADIATIHLGTNDDNAGNMTTLQAIVETQIAALKISNSSARIFYMNVLPKWTNNTTGPEVDKSNIRTAIAAACTAQSVICWDTYSTPWITQDQTSDGTHPTAAGHAAIATQVLARL